MNNANQVKGIIFDMDNTLLKSHIDFAAMKRDIFDYLVELHVLASDFPLHEHTSSTMIEVAKRAGITEQIYASIMNIAAKHELKGMEGAGLEPGVIELLAALYKKYVLVIVTNNSLAAAIKALQLTKVHHYFELVVGREHMNALKPSPSGFNYVKEQFNHIDAAEWIAVGDSWIDGKASEGAGIRFVSYNADAGQMLKKGVEPMRNISSILEVLDIVQHPLTGTQSI